MEAAFSPLFITLFVYKVPLEIGTKVFEFFMVDGPSVLVKILLRMLQHKRKKILRKSEDLLEYLRTEMFYDCSQELTIDKLVNY